MSTKKYIITILSALIVLVLTLAFLSKSQQVSEPISEQIEQLEPKVYTYNINPEGYTLKKSKIKSGESLSTILRGYGLSHLTIDKIARSAQAVFPLRNIRAGNNYTVYLSDDSLSRLDYFVYERNMEDYLAISLLSDTVVVEARSKPVIYELCRAEGEISSSLWNCMMDHNLSPALAAMMSDIYAWNIDFFGLQQHDKFKIVYDQKYVDSLSVGVGNIWGMEFYHGGKTHYAIPFEQDGKLSYWDEDGNSLRKQLLKAPLKYSRISSKFSPSRLHPILKIRRPHYGVDYAAPMGTPVVAVADGVVTSRSYTNGGGNTLKIKHANNLSSGYLHLSRFAKGVSVGSRVEQGQLIGYVGSTGMSTGPHLDFRLWRGTTPIDPLKAPSDPVEPISEENKEAFELVKAKVLAELHGQIADNQL